MAMVSASISIYRATVDYLAVNSSNKYLLNSKRLTNTRAMRKGVSRLLLTSILSSYSILLPSLPILLEFVPWSAALCGADGW